MEDVTIIGGGVAGCSLGYLLTQHGYEVTIVEKSKIGGMLRDIEFDDGTYCDSAPHILFFDDDESEVKKLFSEFSLLKEFDPYAKTYPRGDLSDPHDYPVTKDNIDEWDDAEEIREEIERQPDDVRGDTFDEFVTQQVGPTVYDRYFKSYTAKHWGVEPERITGDWFDYKVSFPETEQPFFGDSNAYRPDRQYKRILEEMIEDCSVVRAEVNGLVTDDGRIEAIETESGERIEGGLFVNTIDPTLLLDDDIDLRYRSMVIVAVRTLLDTEAVFPDGVSWGYFPNDYEFTRVTDYDFIEQNPDEEFIFTFEFPCFVGDETWNRDAEWFRQYVEEFFEDQQLESDIREVELRRAPRAYPLPVESEVETFERVNREVCSYENIYNLGRVSTYQYIWVKDIVKEAYDVAEAIDADLSADATV